MVRMLLRGRRASPSMVVAFLALVLALSGISYAATRLPAHSVGARELKPRSVSRAAIKANAIDGSKVTDDSLSGVDVNEATLAKVPAALAADHAATSDHASAAAAVDRVTYRGTPGSVGPANAVSGSATAGATASCAPGQFVVGGGVRVEDIENTAIVDSFPDAGGTAWTGHVDNSDTAAGHAFSVFAVCVAATSVG
ncbi:MAG: hypothetical protein QOI62_4022 [Solirubrobacteraceae bacterium]|nr:hypothetical protein [Solirubrobacteraceae bacterium]MEA2395673.1 hypothetical protein [Solirubrobacteraceae bacterium]